MERRSGMNAAPALEVDGLVLRYGAHEALRGVSLRVEQGEMFALLGPNGGGKSSLFKVASTLLPATEGTVRILGHDVATHAPSVRKHLGVVFQQPALDRQLTVLESLRIHAALLGVNRGERDDRIFGAMRSLGIETRAKDRVKTLSGGLARRVDLARAFLHHPSLLLLDEPTTGLDPSARRDLWAALESFRADHGTTIVVATHLLDEADACDRVAILDEGKVVAQGTPAGLKAELGADTLWIDTDAPKRLAAAIETLLGLRVRTLSGRLLIDTDAPAGIVGTLYDHFGSDILSLTIRPPTFDDVFAARTGASIAESSRAASGEPNLEVVS
jgi:ABC-2 type transport system ATP-binding protein